MKNVSGIILRVFMGAFYGLLRHGQETLGISVQGTLKDAGSALSFGVIHFTCGI